MIQHPPRSLIGDHDPLDMEEGVDGIATFGGADLVRYVALVGASLLIWITLPGMGLGKTSVMSAIIVTLGGASIGLCAFGFHNHGFLVLAYMSSLEPALRLNSHRLPYNFLEYVVIAACIVPFLRTKVAARWGSVAFALYIVLEAVDVFRSDTQLGYGEEVRTGVFRNIVILGSAKLGMLILGARSDLSGRGILAVILAYLVGSTTLALNGAMNLLGGGVRWGTASNFQITGGMGPNQIGMLLAFGGICILCSLRLSRSRLFRALLVGLLGLHVLTCVATFSRGPAIALGVGVLIYLASQATRNPVIWLPVGVVLIGVVVGATWLIYETSESRLADRYLKKGISNRDTIARGALSLFLENPVLGVGTGNFYAESVRRDIIQGVETGTHNEATRSLAEHGAVGGLIYGLFLAFSFHRAFTLSRGEGRVVRLLLFLMWFFSESYNGLKLNAQSFALAISTEGFAHDPERSIR
ncbi:MAG: O-antigen ligase family protein [Isosphaeraceae bacterium]